MKIKFKHGIQLALALALSIAAYRKIKLFCEIYAGLKDNEQLWNDIDSGQIILPPRLVQEINRHREIAGLEQNILDVTND